MSATSRKFIDPVTKDNVGPGGKNLYYKNAGLFSDPYLDQLPTGKHSSFVLKNWETEALPEFSACYEWMLSTWAEMKEILPKLSEAQLEDKWIKPILQRLGWEYEVQDRLKKWGKTEIPDYSLFESKKTYLKAQGCKTDEAYFEHVMAVADAKQMGIPLDGSKLDKTNPSYQIIWYQQITGKEWGILTDGRYWRLYSTKARSKYSTYFEVNVEKFLGERDDEAFKYFFNFFRMAALAKGAESNQSFLDVVFESGERYAREVEDKLKERAFHLVEMICQGFADGKAALSEDDLRRVYTHSLYYLFRLMFVLNCEAKGLLNVHKQSDYYAFSLRALCSRIKQEFEANQTWSNRHLSYNHINELFELLKRGDERIGIHGFGQEVFSSGDEKFYRENKIPDSFLNRVLLELAFAEEKKEKSLLFIDYKRLAADHLGSLFEGLLEFKLETGKGKQPVLVNSSGERKSTGSYYTPEYVVDYIVAETLGPLVKDKSIEEILELKVVDPAMGSGHFLLGAVRFLEETVMTRLAEMKNKPFDPQLVNWRVLHSCIHGVDINPLAVELAKFSLWMYTARVGCELEPLADQLMCADSLLDQKTWSQGFSAVKKAGGFDAVIGNPPYVRQEFLGGMKDQVESRFKVFHKMADLYTLFVELGVSVLAPHGRFGMIIGNKWMRAEYGKPMRTWLRGQGLELLLDFGDLPVFPGIAAYPSILVIDRSRSPKKFRAVRMKTLEFSSLKSAADDAAVEMEFGSLDDEAWSVESPQQRSLAKKLEGGATSLGEYIGDNVYRGVLTGFNEAFIIDEDTAKRLIKADPKCREIIQPFALGRDIQAYSTIKTKKFIILARRGIDIKKYPSVEKHLAAYKDRLLPKPKDFKGDWKGRKAGSYKWYELQDATDYIDEFKKPKIMFLAFQVRPAFTMDHSGYLANNAAWCIGSEDYFLLGFLNSRVGWYLISRYCTQIRGGYQLIFKYLGKLPVKLPKTDADKKAAKEIEAKVRQLQKAGLDAKGTKLRAEIDQLFYAYYGLKKEEIKAIEEGSYKDGAAADASEDEDLADAA